MEIKEIEHLAELSKLEFTKKELLSFEKEFENLLELAGQIKNCDINSDITLSKINMDNLREDEVGASLSQEEILKNAPFRSDSAFIVPRIME